MELPDPSPTAAIAPEAPAATPRLPRAADTIPGAPSSTSTANLGGRAPASPSFLALRIAAATPAAPPSAVLVELQMVRAELGSVRSQIWATQASLDQTLTEIDAGLSAARDHRDELARANDRLRDLKTRNTVIGVSATVFGFLLGGPIGAIAGNAAGFATLKAVSDLEKQIYATERKIRKNDETLASLGATQQALITERGELEARAGALHERCSALDSLLETQSLEGASPSQLSETYAWAKKTLCDGRALLGDYQALEIRAERLGIEVEDLKLAVQVQTAHAEAVVTEAEQRSQAALFQLALSATGALSMAGTLGEAEAQALKAAVSAAKFFEAPPAERGAYLAGALTAALVPESAASAAKIAEATASLVGASTSDDRAKAKKLLASAAASALTHREMTWLRQLVGLPEAGLAITPLIQSLLEMSRAERERAAKNYQLLA